MTSTPVPAAPPPAGESPARSGAIVAPLHDLGTLLFEGADAASFLQGQLSNDVSALAAGAAQ